VHRPNLIQSFIHAAKGLYYSVHGERNMIIHLIISISVVVMAYLLHLDKIEFIIILICIALVLVTETINTAFEYMVDLFHGAKIDPIVKILKDVSSAAVLIASIFSAIVGILIFYPRLI